MTDPHSTESLLRAALENIEAMLGETLNDDFGFWSSPTNNSRRAFVWGSYKAAEAALAVADTQDDTTDKQDTIMGPNAWRDFLRKAYAERPRITTATAEISGEKVAVDWSGPDITANGKKAGEAMSWAENDAWNIIHNLSVSARQHRGPCDES